MALHTKVDGDGRDGRYLSVSPLLDGKVTVPKHRQPDGPMLPEMAYEIIHDELMLDGSELPVFAFKVRDDVSGFSAYDVSSGMRERGWQVPAYTFPENREDPVALRVVVRNGYSRDPADMFLDDLKRLLVRLEKQSSPTHDESDAGFAH
jgi:glutamate/tyrosine decarboxylase-like PLP-dependent enzyme